MSKGNRKAQSAHQRKGKDMPFAWLAGTGLLLSAYLLTAKAFNAKVYCVVGSGCDVVQSSRFAELFGVPVAAAGVVFYATVLWIALARMDATARWSVLTPLALAGTAASVVFMAVQQLILHTTCSLCVVSALLTVSMLTRLIWRRPPRPALRTWAWGGLTALMTVALIVGGYASSGRKASATSYAEGLATHLATTGVKFYGVYWCPHCQDQKAMFGSAARLLPYVECDSRASDGQPSVCAKAGVRAFPTWEIAGQKLEGVLSLEDLARLSGYPSPSSATQSAPSKP